MGWDVDTKRYDHQNPVYICQDCGGQFVDNGGNIVAPTHWMPLPAPPASVAPPPDLEALREAAIKAIRDAYDTGVEDADMRGRAVRLLDDIIAAIKNFGA